MKGGSYSSDVGIPKATKTIQKAAAVAGNVDTILTVPAGERWLITNIKIELIADATVMTRYPQISTRDPDDDTIFNNAGEGVTASTTRAIYFIFGLTETGKQRNALGYNILDAGDDVLIRIGLGQAGDTYDYVVEYLVIPV